jgi:hypothetical protein
MIGYAGVFAAHISKNWPGIAKRLSNVISAAAAIGEEREIPSSLNRGVPPAVLHSLRWHPPAFPQRAFGVRGSGWSGLKSPRSVLRVADFVSSGAESELIGQVTMPNLESAMYQG